MTTDRLFVILLVMLIPMTGCFGAVDNADAQDDSSDPIDSNNGGNSATNSQQRVWYSSGDAIITHWNDGQDVGSGNSRCEPEAPPP